MGHVSILFTFLLISTLLSALSLDPRLPQFSFHACPQVSFLSWSPGSAQAQVPLLGFLLSLPGCHLIFSSLLMICFQL